MDEKIELIWDMPIAAARVIGANTPDIVIRDKCNKKAYIIDMSCPCDLNVHNKEAEQSQSTAACELNWQKCGTLSVLLYLLW